MMNKQILENYLAETIDTFRSYKKLAERAIEQVSGHEFFALIDAESNSIAMIAKHVGGNLRSRWTDFLTTDGEKPDRRRDEEFVSETDTRESLMQVWETGWNALFETLESLTTDDLSKTIQIRGEDFTVTKALSRSLAHTASHIGQITFLAKHLRSNDWKTLSVPRGKTNEFNNYIAENKDKVHYLDATREFTGQNKKGGREE